MRVIQRQGPAVLYALVQRRPFQELHHDIRRAVFPEHVVDIHDAFGLELGDDARFLHGILNALQEGRVLRGGRGHAGTPADDAQRLGKDFLDGDRALQILMQAFIRNAEAALAQYALNDEFAFMQRGAGGQVVFLRLRTRARSARRAETRAVPHGRAAESALTHDAL